MTSKPPRQLLSVWITDHLKRDLRLAAVYQNTTIRDLVETALTNHLANLPKGKAGRRIPA